MNLSPGDLVITHDMKFMIYHSLMIRGEFAEFPSFVGGSDRYVEGVSGFHHPGIIISCSDKFDIQATNKRPIYVLFPTMMGWLRAWHVIEVLETFDV